MFFSSCKLMGGLGNYLFQISAAYTIALRDSKKLVCDLSDEFSAHNSFTYYSNNIFRKIESVKSIPPYIPIGQNEFSFKEIPIVNNHTKLFGYFQSEKFFLKYKREILELFEIDEKTNEYLIQKYEDLLNKETCSIHVRRGDYLGLPQFHPTQDMDFYEKSVKEIGDDKHFLIFSDDIHWCEENLTFIKNKIFVKGNKDYEDLYLMSFCKDNIICNSTFSWWGAWLNKNSTKKVIAPKKWFGNSNLHFETKDLYCDKWLII